MEIRKGTRQPQARNDSADMVFWTMRITASDTKSPSVAVIWMKLV